MYQQRRNLSTCRTINGSDFCMPKVTLKDRKKDFPHSGVQILNETPVEIR